MSRRSGLLQLSTSSLFGEITFRAGKVVSVFCNAWPRTVGEELVAAGLCDDARLAALLVQQAEGLTGAALLAAAKLNDDRAEAVMEDMLKRAVYRMFEWEDGTFCFTVAEHVDAWHNFALDGLRMVIDRGLSPQYLSLEGARLRDEFSKKEPAQTAPVMQDIFSDTELAAPVSVNTGATAAGAIVAPSESSYDLRRELQSVLGDVASPTEYTQPTSSNAEIVQLRAVLAELRDAGSRQAVLMLVLRYASALYERAVLFVPQNQEFCGLGGFSHGEPADNFVTRVRSMRLASASDLILSQANQGLTIRGRLPQTAANQKLLESLAAPASGPRQRRSMSPDAIVAPLMVGSQGLAATLFADNPTGKALGSNDCLDIFLQQAGLVLECQSLESRLRSLQSVSLAKA